MRAPKADWVFPGGSPGELGYCTRCGQGLSINLSQPVSIMVACMNAFVDLHAKCQPGKFIEKPAQSPEEWAMGRDTGTSSMTIYAAITGRKMTRGRMDIPFDPDDFGRCYRLLKLFPNWRDQLPKVAEVCPRWKPLVEAWDELTEMFESAGWHDETVKPKSDGGKMYNRMREIEKLADQQRR